MAANAAGHIYVADSENNRVQKFEADGTFLDFWGDGTGDGEFQFPVFLPVYIFADNARIGNFIGNTLRNIVIAQIEDLKRKVFRLRF